MKGFITGHGSPEGVKMTFALYRLAGNPRRGTPIGYTLTERSTEGANETLSGRAALAQWLIAEARGTITDRFHELWPQSACPPSDCMGYGPARHEFNYLWNRSDQPLHPGESELFSRFPTAA